MAVTVADVRAVAPELAALLDATIQLFIDDATAELNSKFWGIKLDRGIRYLAAHLSFMHGGASSNAAGGQVTQKKVGDLSVAFSASKSTGSDQDDALSATRWGKEYLRIRKGCGPTWGLTDRNVQDTG